MLTAEALRQYDPLKLAIHLTERLGGGFTTVASILESVGRLAKSYADGRLAEASKGAFLDIGAHRGMVSLAAAQLGWESVVAVEPWPANVTAMEENIQLAEAHAIEIIRAAVVGRGHPPSVALRAIEGSSGQASVSYRMLKNVTQTRVAAIPFTELVSRYAPIGYCKIDIEGGEYGIFDGSDEVVEALRQITWLDIECHGVDWFGFETFPEGAEGRLRETLARAGFVMGDKTWFSGPRDADR